MAVELNASCAFDRAVMHRVPRRGSSCVVVKGVLHKHSSLDSFRLIASQPLWLHFEISAICYLLRMRNRFWV